VLKLPNFKEYVIARVATLSFFAFVFFSVLLYVIVPDRDSLLIFMGVLTLSYLLFIYLAYREANRIQNELQTISSYLEKLEKVDKIDYKANFFTQEFEEINQNLIKVLKKVKKKEAKLKLKNRQRSDMLSAIAHEFRNPIAAIMGYSQTLQDDPNIPKELHDKFLYKIYNNSNNIELLLERLLLWNQFESKETTLQKTNFDLYLLAKEVKSGLCEKYSDREIVLSGSSCSVRADRTLIVLVVKNLVENALKYSKDEITVMVKGSLLSVADKGIGIKEKEIDKVTKKFYRSSTQNWDNSMGLGLSIVKTILSLHKSKLEIESKIGQGSTFSFAI